MEARVEVGIRGSDVEGRGGSGERPSESTAPVKEVGKSWSVEEAWRDTISELSLHGVDNILTKTDSF